MINADLHNTTHAHQPKHKTSSDASRLRDALRDLDEVEEALCTKIGDEFFVQVRGHGCLTKVAELAELHQPADTTLRLIFTEV
jgi:hypothetical protein